MIEDGRLAEAAASAEEILTVLVDTDNAQMRMWAAIYRARAAWHGGDMHLARRWYAEAITQGESHHHVRPMAVVPVGHPARTLGPSRRDAFADHTQRERYGTPWNGAAGAADQGTVGSA